MKIFYKFISILFHPLFIVTYIFLILSQINPFIFGGNDFDSLFKRLFFIILATIIIPLVAVLTLKGVGIIESFEMEDKIERTGPLMVSGLFMIWLFLNAWHGNEFPMAFTVFVLGTVIALFFSFFVNIFFKTSLHAAGMGGFVGGLFIFFVAFKYNTPIHLSIFDMKWVLNMDIIFIISILLAGLVGTARLYLKAHESYQLLSGYFIGFSAQIIALKIITLIS